MTSGGKKLFVAAVLLSTLQVTLSCSCLLMKPKEVICNADFVIKATVETYNPSDSPDLDIAVYTMQVDEIYKSTASFDSVIGDDWKLEVNNYFLTSCEVTFEIEHTYLIAASYSGCGTVKLGLCNFITPWKLLTQDQINTYTVEYVEEGNCEHC